MSHPLDKYREYLAKIESLQLQIFSDGSGRVTTACDERTAYFDTLEELDRLVDEALAPLPTETAYAMSNVLYIFVHPETRAVATVRADCGCIGEGAALDLFSPGSVRGKLAAAVIAFQEKGFSLSNWHVVKSGPLLPTGEVETHVIYAP